MTPTARVVLVCPACGEALTVEHLPGPVACPNCFQPFPLAARSTVQRELETNDEPLRAERPFLLTAWMGVSSLYFAGVVIVLLVNAVSGAAGGGSGADASARAFFVGLLLTVGGAVLTGAAAAGIWKGRSWTRPVLLATWVWVAVAALLSILSVDPPRGTWPAGFVQKVMLAILPTVVILLVGCAATWWYLYRKRNVVAYFDAIGRGRGPA
jgi:hypothetical protein